MQIQCYHCRNVMTVHPQGGQFQCPVCHAVSVVAAPVHPGYHVAPPQAPYYQVRAAPPPTDNRKAYVLGAFMVLGVVGLTLKWWGIALGAALLAWGIAAAIGKVKGPMSLVYPESTKVGALAALSLALGGMVTTCGAMGIVSSASRAEREGREAAEKQEREAAALAERERKAAEDAAAKAARDAELRANVGKAAKDLNAGHDAVQALVDAGKWREAGTKLEAVALAAAEYRSLDPVPDEIASATPREAKLQAAINRVLTVLDAADDLEKNMAEAGELTKGTKDGQAWKTAQAKWQAALKNLDTLEAAGADLQAHVPKGLAAKRTAIEKSLASATKIVDKYDAEQSRMAAFQERCGGCVEVSADQLLQAYADNEARAQSAFGGKRVAVSGIVDSVSLDLFDKPVVNIRGSDRYSFQSVMCQPKNESDANTLDKGQKIVAIGEIGVEVIGSVALEDCEF